MGGRLYVHLGKVTSANIVFKITSHGYLVEVSGGVFTRFGGSKVSHLFMGNAKDFASNIVSFMGCFIANISPVSIVILPSVKK